MGAGSGADRTEAVDMPFPGPTLPCPASCSGPRALAVSRELLGSLDVFQRPTCGGLGDALLGLAELVDERPSRIFDDARDHFLVLGRRVAKGLLGGLGLVREMHHDHARIRRRAPRELRETPGSPFPIEPTAY